MIPGFSGPPADPCREGTTWIQWEMVRYYLITWQKFGES